MRVEFVRGKKSMRGFMPFAQVIKPSDWDISDIFGDSPTDEELEIIESHKRLRFANHCDIRWYWRAKGIGETMRLNRRINSLKAIKRWVKRHGFERGTILLVDSWYVGYSNVVITV